jgi:hypothetical protein
MWLSDDLKISLPEHLVLKLLEREEVATEGGVFLFQGDGLMYSAETPFGSQWEKELTVPLHEVTDLGTSVAWGLLQQSRRGSERAAPAKLPTSHQATLHLDFVSPLQKLAAGEIACAWEQLPYPLILRQRRPSDGAWIDQALKQNGVPRIFGTRWPVLSGPLPGDKALVAVGLAAHSSVAFDGSGRCLSVKNRLVESLNALPLRC